MADLTLLLGSLGETIKSLVTDLVTENNQTVSKELAEKLAEIDKSVKSFEEKIAALAKAIEALKAPVVTNPEPAPTPTPTPTPTPEVPATDTKKVQVTMNGFSGGDWNKGVWIKDGTIRVSIPAVAGLVVGNAATLADGIARKIVNLQEVGADMSLELDGAALNVDLVGGKGVTLTVSASTATPAPTPTPTNPNPVDTAPITDKAFPFLGINLAGAEFGSTYPGTHGKEYIWVTEKDFVKWNDEGMKFIRIPFKWERVQRSLNGELDETEMARMDAAIAAAEKFGMVVNLDMHNYFQRYIGGKGYQIGSSQVPLSAWVDVWKRLATRYKDRKGVHSFGIMNEPTGTNGKWWPAAQQVITMINQVAPNKIITACGDSYANAHGFEAKNAGLKDIKGKNLWIEVHVYFDGDHKGTYGNRGEQINPQIGITRLKDATDFAEKYGFKLFVGETCAPVDMPTAQAALVLFLNKCREKGIPVTYWSGGPWWPASAANGLETGGKIREPISKLRSYRGVTISI